jgi:hypothetical protein
MMHFRSSTHTDFGFFFAGTAAARHPAPHRAYDAGVALMRAARGLIDQTGTPRRSNSATAARPANRRIASKSGRSDEAQLSSQSRLTRQASVVDRPARLRRQWFLS